MVGERLGAYRVVAKLGEGGMGAVFVAEHEELGHRVAIKLLLPELSRDAEIVKRFFREAKAATQIKHPGIVQVFDFGRHPDGSAFIVMELLEGQSLAARLRSRHCLRTVEVCAIGRQVANALAAAHSKGIVHRDLKPDNIVLVADSEVPGGERAKIIDFGIAKLIGDPGLAKTRTGAVFGTAIYMAPEQCRGAGQVDHRADIYSLGCILFEMCCGRPPFVGEGLGEIVGAHLHVAPPSLRGLNRDVPERLETIVLTTLAKDAGDRQQSMIHLAHELERISPRTSGQLFGAFDDDLPPNDHPTIAAGSGHDLGRPEVPGSHEDVQSAASARRLPAAFVVEQVQSDGAGHVDRESRPNTTLRASSGELLSTPMVRHSAWRWATLACVGLALTVALAIGLRMTAHHEDGLRPVTATAAAPTSAAPAAPAPAPVIVPAPPPIVVVPDAGAPKVAVAAPQAIPDAVPSSPTSMTLPASRPGPASEPTTRPLVPDRPKAELVKVSVTSVPSGAVVYLNGKSVGKSPLAVRVESSTARSYVLRFTCVGYADLSVNVSPQHPIVDAKMTRIVGTPRGIDCE